MVKCIFSHLENKNPDDVTQTHREPAPKPPAMLYTLKLLSGIHLTTVQTVVTVEIGSASKSSGLQFSLEKVTGGAIFKQGTSG